MAECVTMPCLIGYGRVSTDDQDLSLLIDVFALQGNVPEYCRFTPTGFFPFLENSLVDIHRALLVSQHLCDMGTHFAQHIAKSYGGSTQHSPDPELVLYHLA